MRDILVLALGSIGAALAVAAIVVMGWIAMNPRDDPSLWGPNKIGPYLRQGIAALVLMAAALAVFTLLTIVDKRLQ